MYILVGDLKDVIKSSLNPHDHVLRMENKWLVGHLALYAAKSIYTYIIIIVRPL